MPESLADFASGGSFGMMGLQERAQLFGGHIVVESQPYGGTTVRLILPRQADLPAQPLAGETTAPYSNASLVVNKA
jgi:signal transduction histidine kinase